MLKAQALVAELFEPGVSPPSTFYKILLLGIRDAYDNHRDLLAGGEPVDGTERLKKHYSEGLRYWMIHDRERAVYHLGGALYHLQDAWLGLAEDPSYEAYLEKTIALEKSPSFSPFTFTAMVSPAQWMEKALEERKKVSSLIQAGLSAPAQKGEQLNQVTLSLTRGAEAAGAGLLVQFFLDSEKG